MEGGELKRDGRELLGVRLKRHYYSNLFGKNVLDSNGRLVGKSVDAYIDIKTFRMKGLMIEGGLFSKRIVLGNGIIGKITDDSVTLNEPFIQKLTGMKVFDSKEKEIGVVTGYCIPFTKTLEVVHVNVYSQNKDFHIPIRCIESIDEIMTLCISEEDVVKENYPKVEE